METVGLGVGVVGLAGLFSACIDCFELVQRGRYHGKDYILLETKFANQRLRLLTWGRACGFRDADQCDDQFDDEIRASLETTLIQLITLFNDGRALRSKYGLKHDQPPQNLLAIGSASINALVPSNFPSKTKLGQRLQELKDSVYKTQKNAKLTNKVRWAIEDKSKFAELVQHLKDLIDDLEGLTRWLNISERQRHIIRCEVESISDLSVLETMEAARLGRIDAVSDAASVRLWDLRDRFLDGTPGDSSNLPNRLRAPSVHSIESDWDEMTYDAQTPPNTIAGTCYQVLHRVVCLHEPTSVSLDAPSYNTKKGNDDQWVLLDKTYPTSDDKSIHLSGQRPVPDLEAYLIQNRQLSFVVFRNYSCSHDGVKSKDHLPKEVDQSIYLCSKELCVELTETFKAFLKPAQQPKFRQGSELRAPYFWFYHSKDYVDLDDKDDRKPAVQALLEFISRTTAQEYSRVDAMVYEETISWEHLPYLFVPGEFVCEANIADERYYQAHEILASELESDERGNPCFFVLHLRTWVYDGTLRPTESSLKIARTQLGNSDEGTIPISDLPVICLAKNYELCAHLLQRGRVFWDCRFRQIRNYSGPVADSEDRFDDRRFMIDPDMYHQLNSKRNLSDNVQSRSDPRDVAITPGITGTSDFLLRLPHTIWGYDLEKHSWHNLFVSGITHVTWARDTFTRLVLPQSTKELLFAMVTSPSERNEVIPGLSRTGQLLLLHGGPGTGKTLVAETMAEMTERPLYRILGSNIGTDATKLEQHFRSISHMCNEWGCVVLLDDADVFLERRAVSDLQRGTLFLIFLRCLDYFAGTVILTTTRVGTFDEAILSRCQLVVHIPSLDDASRKLIWRNLIEMANAEDYIDSDQLDDMVDDMIDASQGIRLNGLEIRNIVKMARLLARSQDKPVARPHFLAVMRNSRDFSKYLQEINRDGDFAREMGNR